MTANRKFSRKLIESIESLIDMVSGAGFTISNIYSWDGGTNVRFMLTGSVQAVAALPDAKRSWAYSPGTAKWQSSASVSEGNRRIEVEYESEAFEVPSSGYSLTFDSEARDIPAGLWCDGQRPYRIEAGTHDIVFANECQIAVEQWLRDRGMTLYGAQAA
jgi:hypothetical protein